MIKQENISNIQDCFNRWSIGDQMIDLLYYKAPSNKISAYIFPPQTSTFAPSIGGFWGLE